MKLMSCRFKLFLAALLCCGSALAGPDKWPNQPVKVLVGIPAGQSTDILMRLLAQRLEPILGQPVVVENKPGAAGAIAMRQLALSNPDGYTLALAFSASLSAIPHIRKDLGYRIEQFSPISTVAATGQVLLVSNEKGVKSLSELVQQAKSRPGAMNYGVAGIATMSHLSVELLDSISGIKMQQVIYQGGPQATVDLAENRIDLYADSIPGALPNIQSGKLRALAVTTKTRQTQLPDTPTVAELGYPEYEVLNWMGLLAPKGTPAEVISLLNKAVNQALKDSSFRNDLQGRGFIALGSTKEEFAEFIDSENKKWGKVLMNARVTQ